MKVVGLISGGKDSVYALVECVRRGHELVAVASLFPPSGDEMDSHMFQTVSVKQLAPAVAECLGLPLVALPLLGRSLRTDLDYVASNDSATAPAGEPYDEVEDLHALLEKVLAEHPDVEAVSSGAVLSTYQRNRVEHVCARLGLTSLAYLWQRQQAALLRDMLHDGMDAVLVKVASMGLTERMLGRSLAALEPKLLELEEQFGFHVCGEGGEYESLAVDCPLFAKRIVLDDTAVRVVEDVPFAPVAQLDVKAFHLEDREAPVAPLPPLPPLPAASCTPAKPPLERALAPLPATPLVAEVAALATPAAAAAATAAAAAAAEQGGVVKADRVLVEGCVGSGDIKAATREAVYALREALAARGMGLEHLAFVQLLVRDMANFAPLNAEYCKLLADLPGGAPSRACVEVGLPENVALVLSAVACRRREVLHVRSFSLWAPVCIGPYSQANELPDGTILVAGQIALDPGTMVLTGDAAAQLKLALQHVRAVLEVRGGRLSDAVSLLVYVACAEAGDLHEALLASWAALTDDSSELPPHALVGVPALPRGAAVEVECVARKATVSPVTPSDDDDEDHDDDDDHAHDSGQGQRVPGKAVLRVVGEPGGEAIGALRRVWYDCGSASARDEAVRRAGDSGALLVPADGLWADGKAVSCVDFFRQ